jgi:hypothetical protein
MRDDQVVEVMGQGNYTGEFLLSPTFSFGNFRRRKLGFGERERMKAGEVRSGSEKPKVFLLLKASEGDEDDLRIQDKRVQGVMDRGIFEQ